MQSDNTEFTEYSVSKLLLQSYFTCLCLLVMFTCTPYKQELLCENWDKKVKSFDQTYIENSQQNTEYNLVILIPTAKVLSISKH